MRKLIASIMLISGFLMVGNVVTSCDKVDDIIDEISVPVPFTIPLSFETTVPFATINTTDLVPYPEVPVNIDVDAKIKEKYPSLSINNLKSAKLDNFNIESVPGSTLTLDAIKDSEIWFKTPDKPEVKIATATGNTSATNLTFTPEPNVDLIDYLRSKQNSVILKIRGSRIAAGQMKIKVNAGFKIEVGL